MINFSNRKKQKKFAMVVCAILVVAMVLGLCIASF